VTVKEFAIGAAYSKAVLVIAQLLNISSLEMSKIHLWRPLLRDTVRLLNSKISLMRYMAVH
jgi:hypothetical protein